MKIPALRLATFGLLFCSRVFAQDSVPLISTTDPAAAWKFNNGQEFPGATGSLTVDADAKREGRASLKLAGDFTKGGRARALGETLDNRGSHDAQTRQQTVQISPWRVAETIQTRRPPARDQSHAAEDRR